MRQVEVETGVYARIWALREAGEETENEILKRILSGYPPPAAAAPGSSISSSPSPARQEETKAVHLASANKATWAHDLVSVLKSVGGKARLERIYEEVEKVRRAHGRSVPRTLEATVRRTLENHSSHSDNYLGGVDLFCMPEGKGAGVWGLR